MSEINVARSSIPPSKLEKGWKMIPTLMRRARFPRRLFVVGIVVCALTVVMVDSALLHEMSSVFTVRPVDVFFLILAASFLLASAVLLYPILALHYRQTILFEEEVKRLNMKYLEGLQEFQRLREEYESPKLSREEAWRNIVEAMSRDYPDFAYLHMTLLDFLSQEKDAIASIREKQTFEQFKKDFIRKLINATAEEILEDTAYSLSAYEMPVSFCMLAVAFGFILSSLVPFLGTEKIQLGSTSINLVWAAGGFIGAYLYSLYPFFQRYTRGDLPPRAFLDYAIKVFLGTIAVTIFGNLFLDAFPAAYHFSVAAVLGSVPFLIMTRAREYVFSKLSWPGSRKVVGDQDVSNITGVTYDYAERLHEEGVMNIQNLAFADTEILSTRTMFNRNMLFDWKDEAILRLLTGDVPMRRLLGERKESGEDSEKKLYDALAEVSINNVTTLANYLQYKTENEGGTYKISLKAAKSLAELLGLPSGEEKYPMLLGRICNQGKKMLGEVIEPSITAFAFKWEEE